MTNFTIIVAIIVSIALMYFVLRFFVNAAFIIAENNQPPIYIPIRVTPKRIENDTGQINGWGIKWCWTCKYFEEENKHCNHPMRTHKEGFNLWVYDTKCGNFECSYNRKEVNNVTTQETQTENEVVGTSQPS